MAYAIARTAKQKGGSVGSSSLHNSRGRETLNADPAREHENKILIGDPEIEVPQRVREIIHEHGGKPRSDSVEAVEILLTASPEWWLDDKGEFDKEKVDQFSQAAESFLLNRKSGGICVRATLHLDERSPHVHAHTVPIDPNGKLNCKHFFGTRALCSEWQTAFYEAVKHLGLERGKEKSYARHTDVKEFYAQITHEHEIKLDYDRLPDPPRIFLTKEGALRFKEEIARAIIEQAKEPIQTELHQAMLARDSHAARVETDKRLAAQKEIAEREKERADVAEKARQELKYKFDELQRQALEIKERCSKAESRIGDISLELVMRESDWKELQFSREHGYRFVHPSLGNEVRVKGSSAHDGVNDVAHNAINLVQHLHRVTGHELTPEKAAGWLADRFGENVARQAYLFEKEKSTYDVFKAHDQERTRQQAQRSREFEPIQRPELVPVRENQGLRRSDKTDHDLPAR